LHIELLLLYQGNTSMSALHGYFLAVIAASFLTSLLVGVVTEDRMKQFLRFIGDLTLILVLLSPLANFSERSFRRSVEDFSRNMEIEQNMAVVDSAMTEQLIIDRCRTYIMDKADKLGAELEVEIILNQVNEISVPAEVYINGQYSAHARDQISQMLEHDFGIPKEKQRWSQNP